MHRTHSAVWDGVGWALEEMRGERSGPGWGGLTVGIAVSVKQSKYCRESKTGS